MHSLEFVIIGILSMPLKKTFCKSVRSSASIFATASQFPRARRASTTFLTFLILSMKSFLLTRGESKKDVTSLHFVSPTPVFPHPRSTA